MTPTPSPNRLVERLRDASEMASGVPVIDELLSEAASRISALEGEVEGLKASLISKVRMIAANARGTTSLGGEELIAFDRLLNIAENQLGRLTPPSGEGGP